MMGAVRELEYNGPIQLAIAAPRPEAGRRGSQALGGD